MCKKDCDCSKCYTKKEGTCVKNCKSLKEVKERVSKEDFEMRQAYELNKKLKKALGRD